MCGVFPLFLYPDNLILSGQMFYCYGLYFRFLVHFYLFVSTPQDILSFLSLFYVYGHFPYYPPHSLVIGVSNISFLFKVCFGYSPYCGTIPYLCPYFPFGGRNCSYYQNRGGTLSYPCFHNIIVGRFSPYHIFGDFLGVIYILLASVFHMVLACIILIIVIFVSMNHFPLEPYTLFYSDYFVLELWNYQYPSHDPRFSPGTYLGKTPLWFYTMRTHRSISHWGRVSTGVSLSQRYSKCSASFWLIVALFYAMTSLEYFEIFQTLPRRQLTLATLSLLRTLVYCGVVLSTPFTKGCTLVPVSLWTPHLDPFSESSLFLFLLSDSIERPTSLIELRPGNAGHGRVKII